MRVALVILGFALGVSALASDGDRAPLADVAERAVQQSKLTLPGSKPFHLKAEIVETTNPSSEYQAKVEQYWVSPTQWRRTIETPGFSQTLVVNGDQVSEKDAGDYLPWWLRDLVTAMTDPLPMLETLKQIGGPMPKPRGANSNTCADLRRIGGGIFCFEGGHGLLTSAHTIGYSAEFQDFKDFGGKRVARLILIDPEPGTTIQARITELSEFSGGDPGLFAVDNPTPPQEQIKSVTVDEATVRRLASDPEVAWPAAENPPTTGKCSVYLTADRAGHIREVWPQGCDNAGLQDSLRETIRKWQLKPATERGIPVQIEAVVNFTFETKLINNHPSINAADPNSPTSTKDVTPAQAARKGPIVMPPRIIQLVKPDCSMNQPCHGIHGDVSVVVNVLVDGTVGDVTVRSGDPQLFDAATSAAKQCTFQPGTFLGNPTSMNFDLKYEF